MKITLAWSATLTYTSWVEGEIFGSINFLSNKKRSFEKNFIIGTISSRDIIYNLSYGNYRFGKSDMVLQNDARKRID